VLDRAGPIVSKLGQSLTESCEHTSSPTWLKSAEDRTTWPPQAIRHGIVKESSRI
jgi:hypothetical protein